MLVTITRVINWSILFAFIACFSYQIVYLIAPYIKKEKTHKPLQMHRYAILIAARNEENVLGGLLDSIHAQNYPSELVDIYVVADNCTDTTAEIAYAHGAYVYERFNRVQIGKGYALKYLLDQISLSDNLEDYDGFFIFDADNLLDENYIKEMNMTFNDGYDAVTSYRNSKNFGDNWISHGYGLWFLHEAQFLNRGRMRIGNSCMVSGTGYMISRELIEKNDGWNFFLLTEDIEFTADCIANGVTIGYCERAEFYDEQPTRLSVSWHQRMRWVKGYFQVYKKYGRQLLSKVGKKGGFSCFDMLMSNLPAFILTMIATFAGLTLNHSGTSDRSGFHICPALCRKIHGQYLCCNAGTWNLYHINGVETYPYGMVQKNRLYVHISDLYADLYSHRFHGNVQESRVETDCARFQSDKSFGSHNRILIGHNFRQESVPSIKNAAVTTVLPALIR